METYIVIDPNEEMRNVIELPIRDGNAVVRSELLK